MLNFFSKVSKFSRIKYERSEKCLEVTLVLKVMIGSNIRAKSFVCFDVLYERKPNKLTPDILKFLKFIVFTSIFL